MKGLHCQSDEYGISNPVLLSCQNHFNGVSLQYAPRGKILQAALEVTMKNMDVFNIKPVFFFVFYCCSNGIHRVFEKCIYIKRSWGLIAGWLPFAVEFCDLV